jgi:hypothetical protein
VNVVTERMVLVSFQIQLLLEHAKAGAKASSDMGKETQSWVGVHTELGETMPVSQIEQNCENVSIVGLWQKAIKNGYRTLGGV